MATFFLSYRRSDTAGITGRNFDRLSAEFGKQSLFMDVDSVPPGVNWKSYLNSAIQKADVMFVIIGDDWRPRLFAPEDQVRLEIELGFANRLRIVPVLVGSTPLPEAKELPPSVRPLLNRQAFRVDTGKSFHQHMDVLIKDLKRITKPTTRLKMGAAAETDAAGSTVVPRSGSTGHLREAPTPRDDKLDRIQILGHILRAGIGGTLAGVVGAMALFLFALFLLLMFHKNILGRDALHADAILAPPGWMDRFDLRAPVVREGIPFRQAYSNEVNRVTIPLAAKTVWAAFAAGPNRWAVVAWLFVVLVLGLLIASYQQAIRSYLSPSWSPLFEAVALLVAGSAGASFAILESPRVDVRLAIYLGLILANATWMALTGFRFRSIVYLIPVVTLGEYMTQAHLVDSFSSTSIWIGCLMLVVPAMLAWSFAPE